LRGSSGKAVDFTVTIKNLNRIAYFISIFEMRIAKPLHIIDEGSVRGFRYARAFFDLKESLGIPKSA